MTRTDVLRLDQRGPVAGPTIVPLLSMCKRPPSDFRPARRVACTEAVDAHSSAAVAVGRSRVRSCIVAALLVIAQDQETVRVRSPLSVADPRFVDYVASLVGVPVTEGDAYQVLENGDAIFPSMLDAIDKAQRRISFESFIYADGEIASRFTSALIARRPTRRSRAIWCSTRSGDGPADLHDPGADRRRHSGGLVQSAGVVVDRGSELPDPPQSPRRRRRRRVHRRRRRGRSLARQCTTARRSGATRSFA